MKRGKVVKPLADELRTPQEHFAWARQRAQEYLDLNQPEKAYASLLVDLSKHEAFHQLQDRLELITRGMNILLERADLTPWLDDLEAAANKQFPKEQTS